MNRFKIGRRSPAPTFRVAVAGLIAVIATMLSACGVGQVSQMAMQEPGVNGNKITVNNVALRNVHLQATQTGDFVQPGRTVELVAVAVNQSPDVADRLVSVTTDIGSVVIRGDAKLPPSGTLMIGTPDGQKVAPGPIGSAGAAKAAVTLAKPISNGLNYNFTFNFEKAGPLTLQVPISAGLTSAP